jgi:hypothetical protein
LSKPDSETKVISTLVLLAYFIALGIIVGKAWEKKDRADRELTERVRRIELGVPPGMPVGMAVPSIFRWDHETESWVPVQATATTGTENGDTP